MDTVINFSDYKIFEIDDKTLELLNQNGKTYAQIKNNLSSVFNENELNDLIKSMKELGLIEVENSVFRNDINKTLGNITSIILLIAQDCNLRCSYCYADEGKYYNSGKMDFNTAKKSVDFLIQKSCSKKLGICFFGGEPLLNFDLIKKLWITATVKKKKQERNLDLV